jgi:hypothetical protein
LKNYIIEFPHRKSVKKKRKTEVIDKLASTLNGDLYLGDILTSITATKLPQTPPAQEERVNLACDIGNMDPFAIRVEGNNQQTIGYVSRSVAKWLSKLLKAELIRAEGRIPARSGTARSLKAPSHPLLISLFRISADENLWDLKEIKSREDVLHQLVYQAYQIATGYRESILIEYLTDGLRPLERQELHPQTHLLMALLKEMRSK